MKLNPVSLWSLLNWDMLVLRNFTSSCLEASSLNDSQGTPKRVLNQSGLSPHLKNHSKMSRMVG